MKVLNSNQLCILILILAWSLTCGIGCGDDDDSADAADDDTNDDTDDDADDDTQADDDIDDGIDDDLNDDVDDDVDDDIDDDADDDVDDDIVGCVDEDGDTYGDNCRMGPDCDDTNPLINPGAPELPGDGIDQDCDDIDLIPNDATGVFVATTGNDNNPGTMAAPLRTINAGAGLALRVTKVVFVAAGEYTRDVETQVSLFGGYKSTGWTRDIEAFLTTIHGQLTVGEPPRNEEDRDGERWKADTRDDNPVAIQGFTINDISNYGTATMAKNIINDVSNYGTATMLDNIIGSVFNSDGTATMENNTIGSVFNVDGMVTIVGNVFFGSVDNFMGAAILVNNEINGGVSNQPDPYGFNMATMTLVNNVIRGQSGGYGSAGVVNGGIATLVNNTISAGTGIYESWGVGSIAGEIMLINNTIDGGSGAHISAGIFLYNIESYSEVSLFHNNIWGQNQIFLVTDWWHFYITDVQELNACAWIGCAEASGNISADPLFVDPAVGDFHLQSASPCIDAGVDPTVYIIPYPDFPEMDFPEMGFDFEGDARPYGAGWDIGADEWTP